MSLKNKSLMKINKTYRSLLDKSIASMLAAIEIYNKPNFSYREDTFAILCVNAWELLLKAIWFKLNHYNHYSIYKKVPKKNKDGTISKLKTIDKNRTGNPKTISLQKVIDLLKPLHIVDSNLESNLYAIIELRDNATHFINLAPITTQIQELGFASIKNYMAFIKSNNINIDLSKYNFYLMPLAYLPSTIDADAILTEPVKNYKNFILRCIEKDNNEGDYDIAISIDVNFKKGSSLHAIEVINSPDGLLITLNEEDIKKRFPWTHKDVTINCKKRYLDFKENAKFHGIMKNIKTDNKLAHERKLDIDNPKSQKKWYYSTNIWKILDNEYTKAK